MEPEIVCEEIVPFDLPPEYCRYEDEGCELSGSCLHCPFSICAYEPGGKRRLLHARRDRKIAMLYEKGKGTAALAAMFDVSRRTIQRILQKHQATRNNNQTYGCNQDRFFQKRDSVPGFPPDRE